MARGGLQPGGEMGRPKGSRNKFPSHQKMHDEFLRHNFDFIKEWVHLFRNVTDDLKVKLIVSTIEFLHPKRKPEDSSGDAGGDAPIGLSITDEQLAILVKVARGEK